VTEALKRGAVALMTLILVVATLTGCTASASRSGSTAEPSPNATPPDLCKNSVVTGCKTVEVDGQSYLYYTDAPQQGDNHAALLVDVGGPGLSLSGVLSIGYQDALRNDLGMLAGGKSLLLIEEPWVSGITDASCSTSSAQFYSWMRTNWRNLASTDIPQMQCPWGQGRYGWNPTTYRKVVATVTAKENFTSLDMAALSFGAVRYSYIDDLVRTATLVRPAAAPGTTNEFVLRARADELWKSLVSRCKGCTAATTRRVANQLVDRYRGKSTDLPGRSVPLTDFDIASALVASAIGNGKDLSLNWKVGVPHVNQDAAAQLSDALWMRIGTEQVSPALVAYADEYCQAYPGGMQPNEGVDPMRNILGAPSFCIGRTSLAPIRQPKPVACLIVGTNDTSAPAALAKTWRVDPTGTTVTSQSRQHWFTDVQDCSNKGRRD
jgi:hypothetical protein